MEQIISDFRKLLEEREEKLSQLTQSNWSAMRKDEIQEDFICDPRRQAYHDLRKKIKGDLNAEGKFMEFQNRIFNS